MQKISKNFKSFQKIFQSKIQKIHKNFHSKIKSDRKKSKNSSRPKRKQWNDKQIQIHKAIVRQNSMAENEKTKVSAMGYCRNSAMGYCRNSKINFAKIRDFFLRKQIFGVWQ